MKPNNHVITEAHRHRSCYDLMAKQRKKIEVMWAEMPNDQMAIMSVGQTCDYLNVGRSTLMRWHDRGVLKAIVNPNNNFKSYLLGHLWVFKVLMLDHNDKSR